MKREAAVQLHGGFFMQIRFCHLWQRAALVSTLRANDGYPLFKGNFFEKMNHKTFLIKAIFIFDKNIRPMFFLCSQNVHGQMV